MTFTGGSGGRNPYRQIVPILQLLDYPLQEVFERFCIGKPGAVPGYCQRTVNCDVILAVLDLKIAEGNRVALVPEGEKLSSASTGGLLRGLRRAEAASEMRRWLRQAHGVLLYGRAELREHIDAYPTLKLRD